MKEELLWGYCIRKCLSFLLILFLRGVECGARKRKSHLARQWTCAPGQESANVEGWEWGGRMLHASLMHQSRNLPNCKGTAAHPELCAGGCPQQHATSQFPLTGSRINIWLISHNIQDVRMLARGMPVPMERLLLRGERFRGLPLQLAGSRMIVRGLECFSHRTAGSNFTAAFYLFPSPLNAAGC